MLKFKIGKTTNEFKVELDGVDITDKLCIKSFSMPEVGPAERTKVRLDILADEVEIELGGEIFEIMGEEPSEGAARRLLKLLSTAKPAEPYPED